MRLHRALPPALLLLLATAALPSASAAPPDPCDLVSCPRPIVVVDEDRVCVGAAGQYGGQALCWFPARPNCVTYYFWNAYAERCVPTDAIWIEPLPDPCDQLRDGCPETGVRPVYAVDTEHACVGVAFDVGGTATCWYAERPACVTQHFGYAYAERCVPTDAISWD